jgi:hypothetical protein
MAMGVARCVPESPTAMTVDPLHAAARRVLLDALEDLAEHRDAIIVMGAQAVYLRAGAAQMGIAEYTTDGDLALVSGRLADAPLLEDAMSTRFSRPPPPGRHRPGRSARRPRTGLGGRLGPLSRRGCLAPGGARPRVPGK